MRIFKERQLREAYQYALEGGQALHLFANPGLYPNAPLCFKRSKEAAHLFDQDKDRLIKTTLRLSVKVIRVLNEGSHKQHVDLCGKPLARAKAESGVT